MFLLPFLILAQAIPALRTETATVSGVLRTSSGSPAAGIRVAATALPDPADPTPAGALVSITETDAEGRYRLENIPAGRYYITAGRVDLPTYYPGTVDVTAGTAITIAQGAQISRIDFALMVQSAGRATMPSSILFMTGPPGINIPLSISVDGGGKVPVMAGANYPVLRLTSTTRPTSATELLFNATSINLPIPSATSPSEYRVELADLPEGYAAKSIIYGSGATAIDLTKNPLRVSAQMVTPSITIGPTGITTASANSNESVFVVLMRNTRVTSASPGVRITGSSIPSVVPIYLSGVSGTVYADGSFEFNGVSPGRHTLVRFTSPSTPAHGISIVVGDRDMGGVKLQSTDILPPDIESDSMRSSGNHATGTIMPFASIHGKVQDASGEPITAGGAVTMTGYRNAKRAFAIDGEGRFKIPNLLPGSYRLELNVSGYKAEVQTTVIDDGDVEITFRGQAERPFQ